DEVGDIPTDLQAKLLRVLQEKEFPRLGSSHNRPFRGRIIAATNRDLRRMVADGRFREDLFDRLNVFPIRVPPLSERREDIPLLADFFLQKYCTILSRPLRSFSKEALEVITAHTWKGNVRELENFVQRLAVLSTGKLLRREEVARELAKADGAIDLSTAPLEQVIEERVREFVERLGDSIESEDDLHGYFLRQMEKPLIKVVMEASGGNQVKAAQVLGINRNTLRKKLSSLSLLSRKKKSR
ncbi:MAG: sigma 54-interacting transcriptional regulator, partial [Candidatus Deferrimicrobiaceae bacterium]